MNSRQVKFAVTSLAVPRTLAALLLLTLIGCTSQPPTEDAAPANDTQQHSHSHDYSQLSFSETVAELQEQQATIQTAFAEGGTPDDAHHALHDVGHLLASIKEKAAGAGLSAEDQQAVDNAVVQLMAAYGDVDQAMHDGQADTSTYAAVASQIDEAMAVLQTQKEAAQE